MAQEKNTILFDDECRDHLLPITFTRPVPCIRTGILTIAEKWERSLNVQASYLTQPYLQKKFPLKTSSVNWFINGSVLPDPRLVAQVNSLQPKQALVQDDVLIAICTNEVSATITYDELRSLLSQATISQPATPPRTIRRLTDIFMKNGEALRDDFKLITFRRRSASIFESNKVLNRHDVFIEEGAKVEFAYLNASYGPIYIGKDVEVMEGAMIRGPFAACEGSTIKMGAKIYFPTTIGPYCKVGGEINHSVILGYTNKGHEGYLGHAVIGEWCNLGADTNNSNLKNDYGEIRLWNYATQNFEDTGLQFCGLVMGDHSKSSINTMFNTGTVVGVFANVFGHGFPRPFIPSFSWGGSSGIVDYRLEKAVEVARLVMARRNVQLTQEDIEILAHIYHQRNR